jgi:glycosyltransferase involved in cell wall biosynthesis
MPTLLVIVPDEISAILKKGEYQPRYYNPGNLFDEVHIMQTNMDHPDPAKLQETVGTARLFMHKVNAPDFKKTFGYHPFFLNRWAGRAVEIAREINPSLIRCHGNWLNGYAAYMIKKKIHIPYLVSMHTNPDEDVRGRIETKEENEYWHAMKRIERISLRNADLVLPVYKPIIPYLKNLGVTKYEVAYNVLNGEHLRQKKSYDLHDPVRIISVGRHFKQKNPENIIRAIKSIPDVHFTLVGHGPYQQYLENAISETGMLDRVTLMPAIQNDELCKMLPEYDIFAIHTEFWEISKSLLEALLSGMPVVLNKRQGEPVPEFSETPLLLVDNTVESYYKAIKTLIEDHSFREDLGRKAYAYAMSHWSPDITEAKYVDIYKRIMLKTGSDL